MTVGLSIDVLVIASVVVGLPLTVRAVRHALQFHPSGPTASSWWERLRYAPGLWLFVVAAAIYLNQVLFTVYVLRTHHGDPSFIARYLPPGWFDLADGSVMRRVAAEFPAPELLAPSVLRVQSALELPLVVLAYLSLARWLDQRFARALMTRPLLWATCVSYSLAFGLAEVTFSNPYTSQDLVLRGLSCIATATLIGRLSRRVLDNHIAQPRSVLQVLAAVVSAAALGVLVLLVYDTALLYNLGRVKGVLPLAIVSVVVLFAARLAARFSSGTGTRRDATWVGVDAMHSSVAWFTALFFAPALSIRYAMEFATAWLAGVAVAGVALAALMLGVLDIPAGLTERDALLTRRRLGQVVVAAFAGTAAATLAMLPPPTYPEARILLAGTLFITAALGTCAATDVLLRRSRRHGNSTLNVETTRRQAPNVHRSEPTARESWP